MIVFFSYQQIRYTLSKVEKIIVLGKGDQNDKIVHDNYPAFEEFMKKYIDLIQSKTLPFYKDTVIIDYISTGSGVYALSLILSHLGFNKPIIINLKKPISDATATDFASIIPVDKSYDILCQTDFGEYFPRIVQAFPQNINELTGTSFKTEFINLVNNPIAQMIIEIALNYPEKNIQENKWYKANLDPSKTKGPPQFGVNDFWIVNIPKANDHNKDNEKGNNKDNGKDNKN